MQFPEPGPEEPEQDLRHAEVASYPTAAAPELKREDLGHDAPLSLTIRPRES